MLDEYDFEKNFITYVKDENANLNVMISKLKFMVNYELFHLDESFHGIFKTIPMWENKKKNCKKIQICLH
jgi:hypothetical protein